MPSNRPQRAKSTQRGVQQIGGAGAEESRSPAPWLVLALVIEQPSHGYELCQRYQRHFGSFVPTSVPRVYAALDRLRDAGLIEPIAMKPASSTPKQHLMRRSYRATRAGVRAYEGWIAERMKDDSQRPQLLGRLTSTGLFGIDAVLGVIDQYQRECMEELRALPAAGAATQRADASLEDVIESLVIDQQRLELRARNDWAVRARQLLESRKGRASGESEHKPSQGKRKR